MSLDDLAVLQGAMEDWPEAPRVSGEISDACRRVIDALPGLVTGQTGWMDIASLVRQVLLTSEHTWNGSPSLRVPQADPWPSGAQWSSVGCRSTPFKDSQLLIRASDWYPRTAGDAWDERAEAQCAACYSDRTVTNPPALPADPFWRAVHGYDTYRGVSQRQAGRAAVLAPSGSSLILALPTGRGKTAVALSRALLNRTGTTIVVVPTVVLAMDMERRTVDLAKHRAAELSPVGRYAYVGDLDEGTKRALRAAVATGQQRVLYASPEALVTGLSSSVLRCAEAGLLRQVVIDEAHLVDQWGNEFRPEFQTIAGLVRRAQAIAPEGSRPVVLMMSATLAERHIGMLDQMFSREGQEADLVWGTQLRAEPAFYHCPSQQEDDRVQVVLRAVARLPRPMIVYTTRPEDSETWVQRLRDAGIHRVACITSKSTSQERLSVIRRWRGDDESGTSVDIVVGTSAFGLGVDMPNVRTVIHACLPETIDRFYQEVGRGGRDGKAVISLLATAPDDFALAARLNSTTVIGNDLGWKRWEAMRNSAKPLGDNRYRVNRTTLPTYLPEGFGQSAQWNVRTLILMSQAGIIRFQAPDLDSQDTTETNWTDLIDYQLVDGSKLAQGAWGNAVDEARRGVHASQAAALDSMRLVTTEIECVNKIIARHYSVRHGGGHLRVAPSCRGCPSCRRRPDSATGGGSLEPSPALPEGNSSVDPLRSWRGNFNWMYIHHDPGADIADLLIVLARRGLNVVSGVQRPIADKVQKSVIPTPIVLDEDADGMTLLSTYQQPMVHVLGTSTDTDVWDRVDSGLPTYVIGPSNAPSPHKVGWAIRELADVAVSMNALLREL